VFHGVVGQSALAEAGQEWIQAHKVGDSEEHLPGIEKYDDQDGVGVGALLTDEVGFAYYGDD
jgi:hypothetical protein